MSRIGQWASYCMPLGLARLLEYRARFASLNLPRSHAWRRPMRAALVVTRIELLPRDALPGIRTVVDVGANVGAWSCGIANLTGASQIVAFEPAPDVFNALCRNTSGYPRIRCIQAAVGPPGQSDAPFFVERATELSSMKRITARGRALHNLDPSPNPPIRVPVVTLDDALRELGEISLMKIDVQGGEADVLAGAHAVLQRTRLLIVEAIYRRGYYEGAATFDELCAQISATSPLKLWAVSEPAMAPDGTPMWADVVFRAQ